LQETGVVFLTAVFGVSSTDHTNKIINFLCNSFIMATKKTVKSKGIKKSISKTVTSYHKDGTLWGRGKMKDDQMDGYWEWFRKTGTIMRSGHFDKGKQVGEWKTYDQDGKVFKVTKMKP